MRTHTVWKYELAPLKDSYVIYMPDGARVLDIQIQYGLPKMWALVEPNQPGVPRLFHLRGTGGLLDTTEISLSKLEHVGTFQLNNGTEVYHVFEELA